MTSFGHCLRVTILYVDIALYYCDNLTRTKGEEFVEVQTAIAQLSGSDSSTGNRPEIYRNTNREASKKYCEVTIKKRYKGQNLLSSFTADWDIN
jgi:hypothetical protein